MGCNSPNHIAAAGRTRGAVRPRCSCDLIVRWPRFPEASRLLATLEHGASFLGEGAHGLVVVLAFHAQDHVARLEVERVLHASDANADRFSLASAMPSVGP